MAQELKPWKNDIPVLLLFFARPTQTAKVFEQIRAARPRVLFLYQDGPRNNRPDDVENIRKCREIVEQIDWDCEVHRKYQDKNYGCDPSEYISQKWMFSQVDRGIILEDDDVPSQSFFPYCIELLERYKDDTRIGIICGMNNINTFENGYSYCFTRYGSIWGWATWRRVIDLWDGDYTWMKDSHLLEILNLTSPNNSSWIQTCIQHKASGREHYESILGAAMRTNNLLNIVPAKNMITNVGIAEESTHSVNDIAKLPRGIRHLFNKKRYEIDFPLKHPSYVIEDIKFNRKFGKRMGGKATMLFRKVESLVYRIIPFLGRI